MSGGSFGYLYSADLLYEHRGDLERMRDELRTYPGGERAADRTAFLLATVDAVQRELESVWQAVEWHVSSDWSADQAVAALAEYNQPPPEHLEGTRAASRQLAEHVRDLDELRKLGRDLRAAGRIVYAEEVEAVVREREAAATTPEGEATS